MKRNLLLACFLFFAFLSCNTKKDEKDSILGKWKPVEMNMKNMDEADKNEFIEKATIEFSADKTFIATRSDTKKNGTYTYSENDKKLVTKVDTESNSETYTTGWEGKLLLLTNENGTVKLKKE